MHELSIAQALVDQATPLLQDQPGRARVVHITVGALSGVDPEALDAAFAMVAEGSAVAGARLAIAHQPARARCEACGGESEVTPDAWVCAHCQSDRLTVTGGRDLTLDAIDVGD